MRIRVEEVIEQDEDRALFGGTDLATQERVSFHVRGPEAARIVKAVRDGKADVEVDLPG